MSSATVRMGLRLRVAPFGSRPCFARPSTLSRSGSKLLRTPFTSAPAPFSSPIYARSFSLWGSSPPPANASSSLPASEFGSGTPESIPPSPFIPDDAVASSNASLPPPSADAFSAAVPAASDAGLPDLWTSTVAPAALQHGELAAAGLVSWYPPGLACSALENIHIFSGLPWFHSIVGLVVAARLALMPLQVAALRNQLRMQPAMEEIEAVNVEMRAATAAGDLGARLAAVARMKRLHDAHGIKMWPMWTTPIAAITTQLGIFFGVKRMCLLPFEPLTHSGVWLLPDLTVSNPLSAVAATSCILLSLQVAKMDALKVEAGHVLNVFQLVSVLACPFLWLLPAGVNLTIIAGSLFQAAQSVVLQRDVVRRLLNIPIITLPQRPTIADTWRDGPAIMRRRAEDNQRKALAAAEAAAQARAKALAERDNQQ